MGTVALETVLVMRSYGEREPMKGPLAYPDSAACFQQLQETMLDASGYIYYKSHSTCVQGPGPALKVHCMCKESGERFNPTSQTTVMITSHGDVFSR